MSNQSTAAETKPNVATQTRFRFAGVGYGVAAVTIWAGVVVATRLGVTTTLGPFDLAALRYGVAGLILLPVAIRRGLALDRLGVGGLIVLATGAGAPYALVFAEGERYAPAADAGVLTPSVMTLLVAVLAALILHERYSAIRVAGFLLILAGAVAVLAATPVTVRESTPHSLGHALLLLAGFLWASYTVAMRRAHLEALHAVSLVSVASLVIYAVPYSVLGGVARLLAAPRGDVIFQAVFQGVIGTIVSLFCYGRAVALLGAAGGAAFAALVPVLTALLAMPLLGEVPDPLAWAGIVLASAGVFFASGVGLPSWKQKGS